VLTAIVVVVVVYAVGLLCALSLCRVAADADAESDDLLADVEDKP
jgi:hypothetical protein